MNEKTTQPNGSRELKVEETEDIERRMQNAGYEFHVNYAEAAFVYELTRSGDSSSNGGNASASNTNKNGSHIITGENGSESFIQKIPFIAIGPFTTLKDSRNRNKKVAEIGGEGKEDTSR